MSELKIPCPQCRAVLKLKDRSLLGKAAKCPKCKHKFKLVEPQPEQPKPQPEQPVKFELVEEPAAPASQPVAGANPTWIPDTPAPAPTVPDTEAQEQNPLDSLFSASSESTQESPTTAGEANPLGFLNHENEGNTTPASEPAAGLNFIETAESPATPLPETSTKAEATPRRKRKKRRKSSGMGMMIVVLLIAGAAGGYIYQQMQNGGSLVTVEEEQTSSGSTQVAVIPAKKNDNAEPLPAVKSELEKQSPTDGQPIQLLHMPAGARIVINLRPAEIWGSESRSAEFRASLGPLGTWLEQQIIDYTRQQPADIEELLLGIILGPQGVAPEWAAVVHLKEAQQRSELLSAYSGKPYQEFNTDIQISNGMAMHIIDDKTISICPEQYIEDALQFASTPALTATQIEQILESTDRDRTMTIVCDPNDLEQHLETLFPEASQLAIEKTLRWLSDDAWAAAWSIHIGEDFYTDLAVLGRNTSKPYELKTRYQERLDVVPELLLTSVRKMDPLRSGYRKIIGRFPAMMKVLSMATVVGVDGDIIRMGTLLPPKAGPNLALGTLLTWDESTRTDFSQQVVVTQTPQVQVKPKTFEEKLQTKMEIDFRRTPLQEAFAYIADESKIEIIVDGDALKLAGFTKNMPQTHKEAGMTTLAAIYVIVKKYEPENDPLAIHIDKAKQQITVLTVKSAAAQNLETYPFSEFKKAANTE